jgi:SAM-dependent methyltransferase
MAVAHGIVRPRAHGLSAVINRVLLRGFMETALRTRYCTEPPSAQTALDIFKGTWKSSLPRDLGLCTGSEESFFADPRVTWVGSLLPNGFSGFDILELGPFEGYDSYLFTTLGARQVTAIEANNINFLKCLLLKDTLGLNIRFLHGDAFEYLRTTDARYDIVWTSGILYHSERPIDLLAQIASRTDRVFIWTHYFVDTLLSDPNNRHYFEPDKNRVQNFGDQTYTLHYRSYRMGTEPGELPLHYEGGLQPYSYWISRADIERVLKSLGFTRLRVQAAGEFSGMPYVGLLAERS